MFAVSRKPISTNTGKFLIKNEVRDSKPKVEDNVPKTNTQNLEHSVRKIFENSNSSKNSPPASDKASTVNSSVSTVPPKEENKEMKRIKIRLSIIRDVPYSQKNSMLNATSDANAEKKSLKKTKEMKIKNKRMNREGNFNCGRWQPDEHERFIEAIMKFGNEWKSVQKHVGTRSSTQARSHAQKFFVKIKKANLVDFNLDLSKNSIKTLHEIANTMNAEEYFNAIKQLNCVAFERKNNNKRRHKKEESSNDSSALFGEAPNPLLNLNNEDLFSLNTNDNSLFNATKGAEGSLNINSFTKNITSNNFNLLNKNNNYQIKIIPNESNKDNSKRHSKPKNEKNLNIGTLIINNNINTYNYNVNINNYNNGTNTKQETQLLKKRNRLNSFEGIMNLFPDLATEFRVNNQFEIKKGFDEREYADNFNCTFKPAKNDFGMEKDLDLENIIMLSQSDDSSSQSLIHFQDEDILFADNKVKKENDFVINDFMLDFDIAKKDNKSCFELEVEHSMSIEDINKPYTVNVDTSFLKF